MAEFIALLVVVGGMAAGVAVARWGGSRMLSLWARGDSIIGRCFATKHANCRFSKLPEARAAQILRMRRIASGCSWLAGFFFVLAALGLPAQFSVMPTIAYCVAGLVLLARGIWLDVLVRMELTR